jgi:hypothetical protein
MRVALVEMTKVHEESDARRWAARIAELVGVSDLTLSVV